MKYTRLLPFMDKEELKKVAYEVLNGELKGVRLETLFPFLGKETLNEIVDLLIEKKEVKYLRNAIPFISKEKVQTIYKAAEAGEIEGFDVSICIPFLGADQVKEIFRELVKKAAEEDDDDDDDDDDDEND